MDGLVGLWTVGLFLGYMSQLLTTVSVSAGENLPQAVIVAGCSNRIYGLTHKMKLAMFDPSTQLWQDCASPTEPEEIHRYLTDHRPALGVLNERLHLIGRHHQIYDTHTDRWRVVAPPPTQRYGHRCVTRAGKLFVIGGVDLVDGTHYTSTMVYGPDRTTNHRGWQSNAWDTIDQTNETLHRVLESFSEFEHDCWIEEQRVCTWLDLEG